MSAPSDPRLDEQVRVPRSRLDRLVARVEALEREVEALQAPPEPSGPASHGPAAEVRSGPVGRRRALAALAGAAVAGTASAVAPAGPVAAANGDQLVAGSVSNGATAATGLAVTGVAATYGFGVTDNGLDSVVGRPALFGHARGSAFTAGVLAYGQGTADALSAFSSRGAAVRAFSSSGVGMQILSSSTTAPGLSVLGGRRGVEVETSQACHLHLAPNGLSPTSAAVDRTPGAIVCNGSQGGQDGPARATLWACVTGGRTAADFRVLAGPETAGSLHVLPVPARIYDSRPGTVPGIGPKTPLAAGEIRTLDLTANASKVPAGATAALLSVLLVNTESGAGNFTVWAGGAPRPLANTMVWGGTAGRHSTTALSRLDAQARVQVSPSIPTHLVIDVVGYYR